MNTDTTTNATHVANNNETPVITRKVGKKAYEVFVHFSTTTNKTMADKIMRLIRSEIGSKDML
jgi:hypothetical protein